MNPIKTYVDHLVDQWAENVRIARDVENPRNLIDVSNAKAEQILDDLQVFYKYIKPVAPDVAEYICERLRPKIPLVVELMKRA